MLYKYTEKQGLHKLTVLEAAAALMKAIPLVGSTPATVAHNTPLKQWMLLAQQRLSQLHNKILGDDDAIKLVIAALPVHRMTAWVYLRFPKVCEKVMARIIEITLRGEDRFEEFIVGGAMSEGWNPSKKKTKRQTPQLPDWMADW